MKILVSPLQHSYSGRFTNHSCPYIIDPKDSSSPRYVNEDLLIMNAVKDGDFHPLRDLLDGSHPNYPDGLDPNYRFPPKDRTLLHLASYYGDPDKVRILLAYGADVNALDSNGDNALYLALNTPERYHSFMILKKEKEYLLMNLLFLQLKLE